MEDVRQEQEGQPEQGYVNQDEATPTSQPTDLSAKVQAERLATDLGGNVQQTASSEEGDWGDWRARSERRGTIYAVLQSLGSAGCNEDQLIARAKRIQQYLDSGE